MKNSLYDPNFEHDACGVGMVADLTARPTHATVYDALTILENLEHRGATGADPESGDGAGFARPDAPRVHTRTLWRRGARRGEYGIAHWMIPKDLDLEYARSTIDHALAEWDSSRRAGATCRLIPACSAPALGERASLRAAIDCQVTR